MLNTLKGAAAVVGVLYLIIGALHSLLFEFLISRSSCLTAKGLVAIYCNSGMAYADTVVTVAWPLYWLQGNEPATAARLTGSDRSDFIAGVTDSCIKKPDNGITSVAPRPYADHYCQCYAEGLAYRLSPDELKGPDTPTSKRIVQEEQRRCFQATKDEVTRDLGHN
jgi:hypothetical protein